MELTKRSLKVYEEILDDPAESRKLKKETADTVALDLAGMRAPTKIDSRSMHMSLSVDELNELKRRGFEAAEAAGKIIDIEGK